MLKYRQATRQEILEHYKYHGRVSFETYVREVPDCRTKNGVRHISKGNAKIRDVAGVPMVRLCGEDMELFADYYTLPDGRTFVSCPTIINPKYR